MHWIFIPNSPYKTTNILALRMGHFLDPNISGLDSSIDDPDDGSAPSYHVFSGSSKILDVLIFFFVHLSACNLFKYTQNKQNFVVFMKNKMVYKEMYIRRYDQVLSG